MVLKKFQEKQVLNLVEKLLDLLLVNLLIV